MDTEKKLPDFDEFMEALKTDLISEGNQQLQAAYDLNVEVTGRMANELWHRMQLYCDALAALMLRNQLMVFTFIRNGEKYRACIVGGIVGVQLVGDDVPKGTMATAGGFSPLDAPPAPAPASSDNTDAEAAQ